MTDIERQQLEAWADGIETGTLDAWAVPAPARDAVQVILLERYVRKRAEAAQRALLATES